MPIKILIAADIVPTKTNNKFFATADTLYLLGEDLQKILASADFIAMNLEVPLTNRISPIRKCGPCLMAPTNTVVGLKAINPYFFTLANNHIKDQDVEGIYSTMAVLKKNGISYAGAGENLEEAKKPFIKQIGKYKIGIYCCAEHEFSIAGKECAGANPFDPLESFDDVRRLKKKCDFVAVLYHGGKEYYRYPTPMLQRVFHKFADCGADLVVAQHTHCIGCKEEYNNSVLVYGQGNFLFDNSNSDFWKTSLLLEILIDAKYDNMQFTTTFIPLIKVNETVRVAKGQKKEHILENFRKRSAEILEENFVEQKFDCLAEEMASTYLLRFSGRVKNNFVVRVLNKLTKFGFIRFLYPDKAKVAIENVLECEVHRELAARVMKK